MREDLEWLEADGLGGFASGTAALIRTRRYHALLLAATTPPTGRFALVNGVEAWIHTASGTTPLSSQRYAPETVFPDGSSRIASFSHDPWPTWVYRLADGTEVEHQLTVAHGAPVVALSWRLVRPSQAATLRVRPLVSGRDIHSLHHENAAFRFDALHEGQRVRWSPYDGVPAVIALANARYVHEPLWYRNFLYTEEAARGLDCVEDLASPGTFAFDLSDGDAVLLLTADVGSAVTLDGLAPDALSRLRNTERQRRMAFASPLHRSADAYIVRRGSGATIVAGYPWFTDWGRDTFIAVRGLAIAAGHLDEATRILLTWACTVSDGMLPNRFHEAAVRPEFNSVDASLWFIIAVHDLLAASERARAPLAKREAALLNDAVHDILAGYATGTRFGIHADSDALLAAGEPGIAPTWMDARVEGRAITPRIGKPVEVQALWINALRLAGQRESKWRDLAGHAQTSFAERFWNPIAMCLYDVVDADHVAGRNDATVRPNQIFAVGGLPTQLMHGPAARAIVDVVQQRLLTPLGLRSLSPDEPGYVPHYVGGVAERDSAYHQGTVWPWLMGAFVDAWLRVRGRTADAQREARAMFLVPLRAHLEDAGLGHVSEIADAEPPFTPRGCPFQAWSLGELLRLDRDILAAPDESA